MLKQMQKKLKRKYKLSQFDLYLVPESMDFEHSNNGMPYIQLESKIAPEEELKQFAFENNCVYIPDTQRFYEIAKYEYLFIINS